MLSRLNVKTFTGSLFALGAIVFFSFLRTPAPDEAQQPGAVAAADAEQPAEPAAVSYDAFGIEVGAFEPEDHTIRRNETFSDLLTPYRVGPETVRALADKARPVFDVRYLRAGKPIRIYQDDSSRANVVVYQTDPVNYVVFDLRDSLHVYSGERPVTITEKEVAGTITSSPYQTLVEEGADPSLAIALSEVFAWQIDFYRIQRGDRFKVVYEEKTVDGEPVGIGTILAARFTHAGEDYFAFNFGDADHSVYYDEQGNSLRKAFLKAPLKYSRISSRYTKRRFHPVLKRYKAHLGTDYAAPTGTPIHATGDGDVIAAGYTRGNGNYVKIRHNGTYTTGYLHMSRIAKGVRRGKRVRQGDVIGFVGSTGLATGPHLCYRFWKNGVQVDPYRQDLPSAEPIAADQRVAFEQVRDLFYPRLLDGPRASTPSLADNGVDPDAHL